MRKTTNLLDWARSLSAMSILLALCTLMFTFTSCSDDDDDDNGSSGSSGSSNGHAYVDLGLSVKWATMNIGSDSPDDYGDYYAWGEIATKDEYTEDNCSTYQLEISDISGRSKYDAATANWGGKWRMPTYTEFTELVNQCTWMWITKSGVKGYQVTGPSGQSIFLPAAGVYYGTTHYYNSEYGYYWTSTPESGDRTYAADHLRFNSEEVTTSIITYRDYGLTIRPVID